eukprot:Gb_34820 [translate_table: standard]
MRNLLSFINTAACVLFLFITLPGRESLDPLYALCVAQSKCGKQRTVHYPFGVGNYGCGHPTTQLQNCEPGQQPQARIKDQIYLVLDYSTYLQRRVTVVNVALFQHCFLPDVNRDLSDTPVFLSQRNHYMTAFSNCKSILPNFTNTLDCNRTWNFGPGLPPKQWRNHCSLSFQLPLLEDPGKGLVPLKLLQKGFQIEWGSIESISEDCVLCMSTRGICGYNLSNPSVFICICEDRPHSKNCSDGKLYSLSKSGIHESKKTRPEVIIGLSIGGVAMIAGGLLFAIYLTRRNTPPNPSLVNRFSMIHSKDLEAALPGREIIDLRIFSYHELERATDYFDVKNELGDGGFGSVYLGKLRDGRAVAVKRLYHDNSRRIQQFINEVRIFSSLHHPNLVALYGCTSAHSPELLLVHEYVSNGTLADHLHGERKGEGLMWEIRLKIALETARALAFLHSVEPPIIHRDVKSSNILLDDNFDAKLADFGLSRLVPVDMTHITTAPQGTPGYLDPEYHECFHLTDKSDVYSFGVVLVEIISGKQAIDITRKRKEISLAHMAEAKIEEGALHELVDPTLEFDSKPDLKVMVTAVAELALACLAKGKDERPHMHQVVAQLEQLKQMGPGNCLGHEVRKDTFHVRQETTGSPAIRRPLSPTSVHEKWSSISTSSYPST